jgi:23S rRNA pseudouridine2457 synthase
VIYKPIDYISQFINNKRRKKPTLGDLQDFPEGTMAIGRLDARSEGLLFLTTDGMESHKVRSKKVEKEYYVQVDGIPDDAAIEKLKTGVEIGFDGKKYMTLPCQARRLEEEPKLPPRGRKIREDRHGPTSWVSVTLTEGKNRQVRKMTAAVGHPTLRLVRVRIADIWLGDMQIGEVREVENFL